MHLKILSYNIHKGFSVTNRKFVLQNIKKAIKLTDADLVLLQEIIGQHDIHSKKIDHWPTCTQLEFLADETWPHYAYGKNAVYEAGHHGNAILSKYPILEWKNINISSNKFEERGLLQTLIQLPNLSIPLLCICVHLSLFRNGQHWQINQIRSAVKAHAHGKGPVIVAGDFNDWRCIASSIFEKDLLEVFQELHGQHARTFPALAPLLRLDRIYYRDILALNASVLSGDPWRSLSDHAPICAELKINEELI